VKEFDVATGSGGQTHVYQIGTRNATTTLELKDGETQVLAGLITDSDQKSSSHIPGLGDMPLLGRLFGTNGSNRSKSEIILSVTPHIIRSLSKPVSENVEFWYGNDGQTHSPPIAKPIDTSGKPGPAGTVKNGASQNIAAPASGAVALQRNVPARSDATAEESGSVSPVGAGDAATSRNASPTTAPSDLPTSDAKAAAAPKATLTLTGPSAAKVGEDVSVEARVDGAAEANRLRTVLRFDPTALQYVSAEAGSAVSAGKIELHAGSVQVDSAGTPVDSSGSVVKAHFKVLAARSTILVSSITTLDKDNGETISANQATPLAITSTP
jgi:general secretion pathway protein D